MLDLLEGQGALFWSAAAAASLGFALLAAAGTLAARRILTRGRLRRPVKRRASAALARATADGYAPAASATAAHAPLRENEYQQLLNRLRAAADSLAELQNDTRQVESSLKGSAKDVDYIFKSGIG